MITNKSGITIRISVADMRVMGRATQGVKVIRIDKGDDIADVAVIKKSEEENEEVNENEEGLTETGTSEEGTTTETDSKEESDTDADSTETPDEETTEDEDTVE